MSSKKVKLLIWLIINEKFIKNLENIQVFINSKHKTEFKQKSKTDSIWFCETEIKMEKENKENKESKENEDQPFQKNIKFIIKAQKNDLKEKIQSANYKIIETNPHQTIFYFFQFTNDEKKTEMLNTSSILKFLNIILFSKKTKILKEDISKKWEIVSALSQIKKPQKVEFYDWIKKLKITQNTQIFLLISLISKIFNLKVAQNLLFGSNKPENKFQDLTELTFEFFSQENQEIESLKNSFKTTISNICRKSKKVDYVKLVPFYLMLKKMQINHNFQVCLKSQELAPNFIILLNVTFLNKSFLDFFNISLFTSIFGTDFHSTKAYEQFLLKLVSHFEIIKNIERYLSVDNFLKLFDKLKFNDMNNFFSFWSPFYIHVKKIIEQNKKKVDKIMTKTFEKILKGSRSTSNTISSEKKIELLQIEEIIMKNFSDQKFQSDQDILILVNFANPDIISHISKFSTNLFNYFSSEITKLYKKVDKDSILDNDKIIKHIPFVQIQCKEWQDFSGIDPQNINYQSSFSSLIPEFKTSGKIPKLSQSFLWFKKSQKLIKDWSTKKIPFLKLLKKYKENLVKFAGNLSSCSCTFQDFSIFSQYKTDYQNLFKSLLIKDLNFEKAESIYNQIQSKSKCLSDFADFYLPETNEMCQKIHNKFISKTKTIETEQKKLSDFDLTFSDFEIDFDLLKWMNILQTSSIFWNLWNSQLQKTSQEKPIKIEQLKTKIIKNTKSEWDQIHKSITDQSIKISKLDLLFSENINDKTWIQKEIKFLNPKYKNEKSNNEKSKNEKYLEEYLKVKEIQLFLLSFFKFCEKYSFENNQNNYQDLFSNWDNWTLSDTTLILSNLNQEFGSVESSIITFFQNLIEIKYQENTSKTEYLYNTDLLDFLLQKKYQNDELFFSEIDPDRMEDGIYKEAVQQLINLRKRMKAYLYSNNTYKSKKYLLQIISHEEARLKSSSHQISFSLIRNSLPGIKEWIQSQKESFQTKAKRNISKIFSEGSTFLFQSSITENKTFICETSQSEKFTFDDFTDFYSFFHDFDFNQNSIQPQNIKKNKSKKNKDNNQNIKKNKENKENDKEQIEDFLDSFKYIEKCTELLSKLTSNSHFKYKNYSYKIPVNKSKKYKQDLNNFQIKLEQDLAEWKKTVNEIFVGFPFLSFFSQEQILGFLHMIQSFFDKQQNSSNLLNSNEKEDFIQILKLYSKSLTVEIIETEIKKTQNTNSEFKEYAKILNDILQKHFDPNRTIKIEDDTLFENHIYKEANKELNKQFNKKSGKVTDPKIFVHSSKNELNVYDIVCTFYYIFSRKFPLREQVLICNEETSEGDISQFLKVYEFYNLDRNIQTNQNTHSSLFSIVHANRLSKKKANFLISSIHSISFDTQFPLVIFCSGSDYLTKNLLYVFSTGEIQNTDIEPIQNNELKKFMKINPFSQRMKVFTSKLAGFGKTFRIRQVCYKENPSSNYHHIVVTSEKKSEIIKQIIDKLANHEKKDIIYFHIEFPYSPKSTISDYIWTLLMWGSIEDKRSFSSINSAWNIPENVRLMFEVPSHRTEDSLQGLKFFPPLKYLEQNECEVNSKSFSFNSYSPTNSEAKTKKLVLQFSKIYQISNPKNKKKQPKKHSTKRAKEFIYEVNEDEELTFRLFANFWRVLKSHIHALMSYNFLNLNMAKELFNNESMGKLFLKQFIKAYFSSVSKMIARSFDWTNTSPDSGLTELKDLCNTFDKALPWEKRDLFIILFVISITKTNDQKTSVNLSGINLLGRDENEMRNCFNPALHKALETNGFVFHKSLPPDSIINEYEKAFSALNSLSFKKFDFKKLSKEHQENKSKYTFTTDNFLKMLFIQYKLFARLPVILLGETGCGKTSLITYLCETVMNQKLKLLTIHGKIKRKEIFNFVENAQKEAEQIGEKIAIFFDEFNTAPKKCLMILKGLFSDRILNGIPISDQIYIFGAANPYRLREEKSENDDFLTDEGLAFDYGERQEEMKLLRRAVYRVHAIPDSFFDDIFDYGILSQNSEQRYIEKMIQNSFSEIDAKKNQIVTNREATFILLSRVLFECHNFLRENSNDERSAVSLRDTSKALRIFKWLLTEKIGNLIIDSKNPKEKLVNAFIVSLFVCFGCRFNTGVRI
ncbi:hypothetical protein M0811_02467 [Anaeramoeba ignava]|uniref:AAA+ ATPase domain-containing protein n=1 Tax=Anaeramoeba ignava TaxID=1746090 RepID=A0A9Q0R7A2_ANAIG|nr:hypothetical protein M0811_02467 [Anaeramoeba ignava]